MVETEQTSWLDELCTLIEEKLADQKKVKFNTHKNRKLFTSELCGLIKDAINKNTQPIPTNIGRNKATITHPNPNATSRGVTIMTEGDSAKGDDVLQSVIDMKKSVRVW